MTLPDKARVRDALVAALTTVMEQAAASAKTTREGATHAEAKPENDKDTRALEQSYLARGQAMRVEDLQEQIQVLRFMPLLRFGEDDAIAASALLRLEGEDGADDRCAFLAPYGGGTELNVDGTRVLVLTPQSPLGQLLVGRYRDDEIEQRVRGSLRTFVIAALQ